MQNYYPGKTVLLFAVLSCVLVLPLLALQTQAQNRSQPTGQKNTKVNNQMSSLKPDTLLPEGSTRLLPDNSIKNLQLEAPAGSTVLKHVQVQGQPFTNAIQVSTLRRLPNDEDSKLALNTIAGFEPGDVLFVRLYVRMIKTEDETGEGALTLTLRKDDPKDKYAVFFPIRFTCNEQWQGIDLPIPARRGFKAGETKFIIGVGGTQPQVIELGGLQVLNYARKVKEQDLPFTRKTYQGREADAPWRKEAADRIEKYRKGTLNIEVTDAGNKPLKGAAVEVKMQRHAFGFGTEINSQYFIKSEGTPNGIKYRDAIKKYFNEAVIGNGLKWIAWENPERRQEAIQTVKWLRDNQLQVRGHNLVWPGWKHLPKSLMAVKDNPDTLRKRVRDHIIEEGNQFKGQLEDWDVTNETFGNKDLMNILGKEEMVEWYKLARKTDPDVKLYINENSVLTGKKLDFYLNEIQYLIDHKAPLDGIGEQGHMSPMSIEQVWKNLNQLATLKLPIKITEFDVVTPDEELQADWTRDFLTLIFSHPITEGFVMWGFWDSEHWLKDAPLFYTDWSLKPSGKVWIDLINKQWWTNAKGETGTNGHYQARGFLGDYTISVQANGKTKTVPATLVREGSTVKVKLN